MCSLSLSLSLWRARALSRPPPLLSLLGTCLRDQRGTHPFRSRAPPRKSRESLGTHKHTHTHTHTHKRFRVEHHHEEAQNHWAHTHTHTHTHTHNVVPASLMAPAQRGRTDSQSRKVSNILTQILKSQCPSIFTIQSHNVVAFSKEEVLKRGLLRVCCQRTRTEPMRRHSDLDYSGREGGREGGREKNSYIL
jgi:hypothetical protein